MGIIKQLDKRTGITYVYESKAFWDKEKHQSRAQRTLIGKIDPETGEMIPTDGRHRKTEAPDEKEPDYKKLYEKLLKKYEAQEVLVKSLILSRKSCIVSLLIALIRSSTSFVPVTKSTFLPSLFEISNPIAFNR